MPSDIVKTFEKRRGRESTRDLVMKERGALLTKNGKYPDLTLVLFLYFSGGSLRALGQC